METPDYEVPDVLIEIAAATAFVLVALGLLWPPRAVYWEGVADAIGRNVTLAVVGVIALALGAWFARTTALARRHILAGAILAYVLGMAAIEVLLVPDSPVHLLWYGLLLGCLLAGVLAWEGFDRYVATGRAG